jgi:MFS family permease
LSYPLYRRYWLASLASVGGWQISAIAMGWLVFELSGSAFDLGVLGAATALPAIILTIAGGVIADRFEKRAVLIVTTALNVVLLCVLAVLEFSGVVTVWHIWLIAAAISIVSGVDWPTRQSFFPHLIEKPALLSAVALNSVLWQSTRMVLPALGGVMLAWLQAGYVFMLAALGYGIMLWVIFGIRLHLPGSVTQSVLEQTREGVRFILQTPLFRNLILLSYATMFFLSAYMQLMPAFAGLFEAGPAGFGVLMSATGVGSITGTAIAGGFKVGRHYGSVMLFAALAGTVFLFAFAATALLPNYGLGLAVVMLAAAATSVFLIFSTTALQSQVPDELRGRVMGIHGITYSLMPMGALLTGSLAQPLGTAQALMVSLTIYVCLLMFLGFGKKSIRDLSAPTD